MIIISTKHLNSSFSNKDNKSPSRINNFDATRKTINLNNFPNNSYNKRTINFHASLKKTLPQIIAGANELYYYNGYPLVASYAPESCIRIVKFDGKSIKRYLATGRCMTCSKIIILASGTNGNVGAVIHLDVGEKLIKSSKNIKARLLEEGADFKNMTIHHVKGTMNTPAAHIKAVDIFMNDIGLQPEQLIKELDGIHQDGIIADIAQRQTYELRAPWTFFREFYAPSSKAKLMMDYKNILTPEEYEKIEKEIWIIDKSNNIADSGFLKNIIARSTLTEIPL